MKNYTILSTILFIAEQTYPLYFGRYSELQYPPDASRYNRSTLSNVRQNILQNYTIRYTPVVIAKLNSPLYVGRYCRNTLHYGR